jgi:hypothetical protein
VPLDVAAPLTPADLNGDSIHITVASVF